MVAEDFVQLDGIGTVLFEPRGEAFVQLRSHRFRQSVVGCIANQQMAKAERVVACELRLVRPDEFLPDEGHQPRRHLCLFRCERFDRSSVEHLALDRAAFEHGAFGRVELIEPCGEQRLDGRRHDDLSAVPRLAHHGEHLLDEQRVAFGGLADARAQGVVDRRKALDQLVRLLRRERLEQDRRRVQLAAGPTRAPVEQLRPGHAEQQDRRIATEVGDVLHQVEKGWLAPVQVVEDRDEWPFRRCLLECFSHGPGDLVGGGRFVRLSEQYADGCSRCVVGGLRS